MRLQRELQTQGVLSEAVLTYVKIHGFLIIKINMTGAFNNNSSSDDFSPRDNPVMNVKQQSGKPQNIGMFNSI